MIVRNISKTIHALNTYASRGIHFLYELFIRPKSGTEDSQRREFILNIILVGFTSLLIFLDFFVVVSYLRFGNTHSSTPVWLFTAFVAIFIGLIILSRMGYIRIAAYALVFIQYLLVTYAMSRWGIEMPLGVLAYIVAIIAASILINTRTGFVMTALITVTVFSIGWIEVKHPEYFSMEWKQENILIHDPIQYSAGFFLIVTLAWLSNREIESSLNRARKSEHALKLERDNLEITVEERTRELKDAQLEKTASLYRMAEFGRLSSGLFHDLMNPLQGIIAAVEDLDANPSQKRIEQIKDAIERSAHASRRMSNFLGTIRKHINPREMDTVFSLNKELHEAKDILRFRARIAHVVINLKESKELVIFGNPLKFHQIAVNLLINAIDACEGRSDQEPCVIHAKLSKFDGQAQLKITDHGVGIPEHLITKIFDPFFTTKAKHKGMGLGLSTTKSIVEKDFGGTISVTSKEGVGTTFMVLIPIRKEPNIL